MSNVLALDLGTSTGYAARIGEATVSGVWNFKRKKGGAWEDPLINFRDRMIEFYGEVGGLDAVVYEDVKFHHGVAAAHLYAGFKTVLLLGAYGVAVPTYGFGPTEWKKLVIGTGKGRKEGSLGATRALGFEPETDDEADAICLLWAYEKRYGG